MRVALLGCGKQKAARTCRASEMYRSVLFRAGLRYAIDTCDRVLILSAKHGLLEPDQVIEPYDETLPRDRPGRDAWGLRVGGQLDAAVPDLDAEIIVLAGERYADAISTDPDHPDGARYFNWEEPLRGLGIGERLAWFKAQRHRAREAA